VSPEDATVSEDGTVSILPDELVRAWPKPPEVRGRVWKNWSLENRRNWLLHHAFVVSGDQVIIRPENRHTKTSQHVVQAASTVEGGRTLLAAIYDLHVDTLPMDGEGYPIEGSEGNRIKTVLNVLAAIFLIAMVAILVVVMFGGDDDGSSQPAADAPVVADAADQPDHPQGDADRPTDGADEANAAEPGSGEEAGEPGSGGVSDSGEAGDVPESPEDGLPDFSDAAGTYRLVEDSARLALKPMIVEFESAEGSITIENDGAVNGDFRYVYTDFMGDDLLARVLFHATFTGQTLESTDNGFTFAGTLPVQLRVEPQGSPNSDAAIPDPFTTSVTFDVIGLVDPEAGSLELSQLGEDGTPATVTFRL